MDKSLHSKRWLKRALIPALVLAICAILGAGIFEARSNPHFLNLILHPEDSLRYFLTHYGVGAYAILFLIVFCETGLVVTPFLPGDSLLFAVGATAASGLISPFAICLTLILAALLGDNANYFLGCRFGRRLFHNEKSKIFNRKSLEKTHLFFEKYGARTVIVARFLPVFRTFAPFVAGMGRMSYRLFMLYSVLAASLWVVLCVSIGFSVGSAPWAKKHFWVILLLMIVISAVPGFLEIYRHYRQHQREQALLFAGPDQRAVAEATTE